MQLIPDAVLVADGRGAIVACNRLAEELFGYARAELLGLTVEALMPERFREGHTRHRQRFAAAPVPRPMGRDVDLRARRRDGSEIAVEISLGPMKSVGPGLILVAVRDVSRRRRNEEILRQREQWLSTVLESIGDGVVTTDTAGRLTHLNRTAERLTGWTKSETAQRSIDEVVRLLDEESGEPVTSSFARSAPDHAGELPRNASLLSRDRGRIPVGHSVAPIRDAGGRVLGAVIVLRDRTQENAAAAALSESEARLRQAQKMDAIGQLAGGIAHDFNNLLTAIQGFGTVVLERLAPGDSVRGDMEDILNATMQASGLTRQLLAFSRRQVLQPRILRVGNHLRDMERMLGRVIGEDIELVVNVGAPIAAVKVDPSQLEQVVMNLVVNARDAMPGGGILTLAVESAALDAAYAATHPEVPPGQYVAMSVTDTGMGIDPALRSRIFEPFFTTKEHGRGSGLGLATVFGIVKQSGGSISVYSEIGRGTTFRVYLPVASEHDVPASAEAASPPRGGSETILLVEDEELVRRFVHRLLTTRGYRVLVAASGAEAMALAAREPDPIHLLLSDVIMPAMSGPELARQLGGLRPAMRTLYMSGYPGEVMARAGELQAGISFIQKPLGLDALLIAIRKVLDRPPPPTSADGPG